MTKQIDVSSGDVEPLESVAEKEFVLLDAGPHGRAARARSTACVITWTTTTRRGSMAMGSTQALQREPADLAPFLKLDTHNRSIPLQQPCDAHQPAKTRGPGVLPAAVEHQAVEGRPQQRVGLFAEHAVLESNVYAADAS
jgi:hypothetical protein